MSQVSKDNLILSLTNILTGNRVKTETIMTALELICNNASCHSGLIYEADLLDRFCLLERYMSCPVSFPDHLSADEFTLQDRTLLAQGTMSRIVRNPQNTPFELRLLSRFTTEALVLMPVLDENSTLYGLVLLLGPSPHDSLTETDIATLSAALSILVRYVEMRMYQRKLLQTQITMESILDNTGIDIYVNDFYSHEILYVNKSMAAPYGGPAQFMGQKCWQVLFPGQMAPCDFCPQNKLIDDQGKPTGKAYVWDYQRPFDGSWFRVFSAAFQWVDGRLVHVVSSADITDNKRNEALVENMANYDQLTQLPNRRMLVKKCKQRINNATAIEKGFLLFFDIDGFKLINDHFGHDSGDEFLVQLGNFFSSIPLLKNSIYRNGGDEFVALIGGETITKANIQILANFIHTRFKKPWVLKKGEVFCNTSIGVACYPEDGITAETLLQKADMAMYQVKKTGGGKLCFADQLINIPSS